LTTFLSSLTLASLSVNGCVVISNKRKFCFSVVRTPFSTKFFANRSLTFFSWYLIFKGFHVSPVNKNQIYYAHIMLVINADLYVKTYKI